MKNKTYVSLLTLAALLLPHSASAFEYRFNYSKLYSQMKNNAKEGHPDVKVAFFFQQRGTHKTCVIDKAWMEKEEHYEALTLPDNRELIVPLDNNLRKAGPLVFVHTGETCDFSMVVMTKSPLTGEVKQETVRSLAAQMESMIGDLGGMFSGWFTKKVVGLTLEFEDIENGSIALSNGKSIDIRNARAKVKISDIPDNGYMRLPSPTYRTLALLEE